ncbi:MAG: hypothetical protein J6E48_13345, partial [Prevotella sp.]|nr:hypothetical protein [Prevotella sp.]
QKLKYDLSQHTTDGNTFRDIFELEVEGEAGADVPDTCCTSWYSDGLAGTLLCPTWRELGGS